jgi:hypothetical protein
MTRFTFDAACTVDMAAPAIANSIANRIFRMALS